MRKLFNFTKSAELKQKLAEIVTELKKIDFICKEACEQYCNNDNCTSCFLDKRPIYKAIFSGLKNIDELKTQNKKLEQENDSLEDDVDYLRKDSRKESNDYETQIKTLKDEINILYDRVTSLNKALALWEVTKIKNV